jgi:hypothetical protein
MRCTGFKASQGFDVARDRRLLALLGLRPRNPSSPGHLMNGS